MKKEYLKNKDLHKELIICQNKGELSRTLYKMFMLMIDRYTWTLTYNDYNIREDCIGYAVEKLYRGYHKYDPDKADGNAFAYVTQIIKNAFYFEFNRQIGMKAKGKLDLIPLSRLFSDGEINI